MYRAVEMLHLLKYSCPAFFVNTTSCVMPGFDKMMSRYLEWFFKLKVFLSVSVR